MSLILEALRKLEREKETKERGFLVVAASSWPERGRTHWVAVLVATLLLAAAAGAVWLVKWRRGALSEAPSLAIQTPGPPPPAEARTTRPVVQRPAPPSPNTPPPVSPRPAPEVTPSALPSPEALVLQAISERDGQPIALVSDHLVRVGDSFDGVKILRIGEGEVEIESQGRRILLHF